MVLDKTVGIAAVMVALRDTSDADSPSEFARLVKHRRRRFVGINSLPAAALV
jgi:hypothetical protein